MIDNQSETWRYITAWIDREQSMCRDQVAQQGLPPLDTEFLRGRIAALNDVRNLAAEKPAIKSAPVLT